MTTGVTKRRVELVGIPFHSGKSEQDEKSETEETTVNTRLAIVSQPTRLRAFVVDSRRERDRHVVEFICRQAVRIRHASAASSKVVRAMGPTGHPR